MTVAETLTRNGYTVEIVYMEGDCESPRENENVSLFLGFPHRSYKIGDETFDPTEYERTCPSCEGQGVHETRQDNGDVITNDCTTCNTYGRVSPTSEAQVMEWLKEDHGATVVLKVGMIDHSGVSYYIGGGASIFDPGGWDSGTCGYILDTKENRERLGIEDFTEEQITKALTEELQEYDRWARGECFGIVVKDLNGEVVESCWGFIGSEYVMESVDDYVPTEPPPAKKYAVYLTDAELAMAADSILYDLGANAERHLLDVETLRAVSDKIAAARPKPKEDAPE